MIRSGCAFFRYLKVANSRRKTFDALPLLGEIYIEKINVWWHFIKQYRIEENY